MRDIEKVTLFTDKCLLNPVYHPSVGIILRDKGTTKTWLSLHPTWRPTYYTQGRPSGGKNKYAPKLWKL